MKENWLVITKCNEVRYAIPSSKKNVAHLQRMFHIRTLNLSLTSKYQVSTDRVDIEIKGYERPGFYPH